MEQDDIFFIAKDIWEKHHSCCLGGEKTMSTSPYVRFLTSRSYKKSVSLAPFHRRRNWGTEQENNLFISHSETSGCARNGAQVFWNLMSSADSWESWSPYKVQLNVFIDFFLFVCLFEVRKYLFPKTEALLLPTWQLWWQMMPESIASSQGEFSSGLPPPWHICWPCHHKLFAVVVPEMEMWRMEKCPSPSDMTWRTSALQLSLTSWQRFCSPSWEGDPTWWVFLHGGELEHCQPFPLGCRMELEHCVLTDSLPGSLVMLSHPIKPLPLW